MNKLRIAIIGTGGIANAHINAYLQMEDVEIVGGSDIIPGKARAFFDRYNLPDARDFEDTEEMLRTLKPDAVSVCTYNSTHAVCAIAALRAGCHVLLEKPMTGRTPRKSAGWKRKPARSSPSASSPVMTAG